MTAFEACKLFEQLKRENETNTEEERQFNNEWLKLIYKAWGNAFDKTYRNNKVKPDSITTKRSTCL
jgi:hypothetical protein